MGTSRNVTVTDRDGLVAFPDALPERRISSVCAVAAAILLIVVLGGTALVDLVSPAPALTLIGAEKRRDARLRSVARLWDGSLFRLWEHDLRLRSRVRRQVTDAYGWVLYRYFRHVQGNLVVGPRGWLFLGYRTSVADETDEDLARRAGAAMAAIDRRIHALGMRAIIIPVPRKAALHADELPGTVRSRPEVDRAVVRDLEERGIEVVDLWKVFEQDLSGPAYHMLGSHWTDEAQVVAAREAAAACGDSQTPEGGWRVLKSTGLSLDVDTDLLKFAGIHGEYRLPGLAAREGFNLVETKGLHTPPLLEDEPGRVVILGTSFTYRRKFPTLIAHFLGEGIWSGARAGSFPGDVLASFTSSAYKRGKTELVLFEVPCHHLVRQPLAGIVEPAFAEPPPPGILRYGQVRDDHLLVKSGKTTAIRKGRTLVSIPAGSMAHTGDGVVALRVRGASSAGVSLKLELTDGLSLTIPWGDDVPEVNLPLIALGPSSQTVKLKAFSRNPKASISIESVEIVSETPPLPRLDLSSERPIATSTGWEIVFDPTSEVRMGALSLLELGLGVKGRFSGDVRVEVTTTDGTGALRAEWRGLTKGALVVLSLAPLRGEVIESIRLTGSGDPPERVLHRAVLRLGI